MVLLALSAGNYLSASILSFAKLFLVVAAKSAMLRRILKSLERVLWSRVAMGTKVKAKMAFLPQISHPCCGAVWEGNDAILIVEALPLHQQSFSPCVVDFILYFLSE